METERYLDQRERWPKGGRHILAQYDGETIAVYQAYRDSIGRYAAENQRFGGEFKFARMSWIKPNFLWMMYRSGWGTKVGQEVTLAITITRRLFDEILEDAVPSIFPKERYTDHESWKTSVANSEVRLQWDPDHAPSGEPENRKAIQLGLRGNILRRYGREGIVSVKDISGFVEQQRVKMKTEPWKLETPKEEVYWPESRLARENVGIQTHP